MQILSIMTIFSFEACALKIRLRGRLCQSLGVSVDHCVVSNKSNYKTALLQI